MIHDGVLYDLIQGQGQRHRFLKVAKIADFEVLFRMHVIKRLIMNYDTLRYNI